MKLHAFIAIPMLTLGLAGLAAAQPTTSGNTSGGGAKSADTTRPDSGAPADASMSKGSNTKMTEDKSKMGKGKDMKDGKKMSDNPSAAPGAAGNAGSPNSKSSAAKTNP